MITAGCRRHTSVLHTAVHRTAASDTVTDSAVMSPSRVRHTAQAQHGPSVAVTRPPRVLCCECIMQRNVFDRYVSDRRRAPAAYRRNKKQPVDNSPAQNGMREGASGSDRHSNLSRTFIFRRQRSIPVCLSVCLSAVREPRSLDGTIRGTAERSEVEM